MTIENPDMPDETMTADEVVMQFGRLLWMAASERHGGLTIDREAIQNYPGDDRANLTFHENTDGSITITHGLKNAKQN